MKKELHNPLSHIFIKILFTLGCFFINISFIVLAFNEILIKNDKFDFNLVFIISLIFIVLGIVFSAVFIFLRFYIFKNLDFKYNNYEIAYNYKWIILLSCLLLLSIINLILFNTLKSNIYNVGYINWIMLACSFPFSIASSIYEVKSKVRQMSLISKKWDAENEGQEQKVEKQKKLDTVLNQELVKDNEIFEGEIQKEEKEKKDD